MRSPSVLSGSWVAYAVVGLAAIAGYFVILDPATQGTVHALCGMSAIAAILLGIRLWRPARAGAWLTLAAGVALETLGDILFALLGAPDRLALSPLLWHVAWIAGYAVIAVGLVELARGATRAQALVGWVDALIAATAASIVLWILVIRPGIASSVDTPSAVLAVAYPFLNVIQIALVAHLLLSGRRTPAVVFVGAGLTASFVAGTAYALLGLEAAGPAGQLVDAGWLVSYVALGTAALHPTMAVSAAGPAAERDGHATLTRVRLVFLASAPLTGPLLMALQVTLGQSPDTVAIVGGLSVVYLLILLRVVLAVAALRGAVRERSALAVELAEQASHDSLTGLVNRRAFLARLETALVSQDDGRATAVLYVDLDRLKVINDADGHAAGDAALAAVGERLRLGLGSADAVARLGGDEFGILLGSATESEALVVAARTTTLLDEPVSIGAQAVRLSGSVGVALARPGDTAQDLLRNADRAMYRAKAAGGASYAQYSEELQAESAERLEFLDDLSLAVERGELVLHYQPIVNLRSGATVGLEALVRWEHPTRGLLLPGTFIGLAEEAGLILPIGRWVLREAVRQASEWRRRGLLRRPVVIDVNVAARQLADPGFAREVASAISGTGMGAGQIALELTETELIHDPEAVGRQLALLRKGGLQVAIDDFGTAYASMSYLVNFPVDGMKIDRQFVRELDFGAGPGRALVSSMIGLARQLDIWAVAEGVETEAQAQALRELGCSYAQGFLFSRPVPAEQVEPFLASASSWAASDAVSAGPRRLSAR